MFHHDEPQKTTSESTFQSSSLKQLLLMLNLFFMHPCFSALFFYSIFQILSCCVSVTCDVDWQSNWSLNLLNISVSIIGFDSCLVISGCQFSENKHHIQTGGDASILQSWTTMIQSQSLLQLLLFGGCFFSLPNAARVHWVHENRKEELEESSQLCCQNQVLF